MTSFRYKAMTRSGVIIRGTLDAPSEAVVIRHLRNEGHLPLSTSTDSTRQFFGKLKRHLPESASLRALATVTRELADLLSAEVELDRALAFTSDLHSTMLSQSFVQVRARIRAGSTFAEALSRHPVFPKFYVSMVRAGEAGGVMPSTLRSLADYLERSLATRDAILSALIYPIILAVTAALSVCFILIFVIPSFAPLFASTGQTLPLPTRIAMALSDALRQFWWLAAIGITAVAFCLKRAFADPIVRRRYQAKILKIPLIGSLLVDIELERFKRMLGTLIASGLPLPAALVLSRDIIRNSEIAAAIQSAGQSLREGDSLARLLSKSPFFPSATLDLLRIGEETGRLDDMLIRQADLDERRIRHRVDRLLAMLVPALTIGLGLVVAALIASMLTALLSVNSMAFQ